MLELPVRSLLATESGRGCTSLLLNPADPVDRVVDWGGCSELLDVRRRQRSRSRSIPSTISLKVRLRLTLVASDDEGWATEVLVSVLANDASAESAAFVGGSVFLERLRSNAWGLTFSLSRQTISSSESVLMCGTVVAAAVGFGGDDEPSAGGEYRSLVNASIKARLGACF